MRRTVWIGVVTVFLGVEIAALAQTTSKAPAYNVKDEVTMTGKVLKVETIPDWMGKDGVNVALEISDTAKASHVDVATAGFLRMFDFQIDIGDELRMVGCWSKSVDGTPVFLVHELKKQRVMLNVRGPAGDPLW